VLAINRLDPDLRIVKQSEVTFFLRTLSPDT
jgi:hypothetical protein